MSCATNATWGNILVPTVALAAGVASTGVGIAVTRAGGALTFVGDAMAIGGVAFTAGVGAAASHFNDDGEVGW